MVAFLKKEGIIHEKMIAYLPELNGVAERFNCMLLEGKRSLSFTANISTMLWVDIVATAVHVRNCFPYCFNN